MGMPGPKPGSPQSKKKSPPRQHSSDKPKKRGKVGKKGGKKPPAKKAAKKPAKGKEKAAASDKPGLWSRLLSASKSPPARPARDPSPTPPPAAAAATKPASPVSASTPERDMAAGRSLLPDPSAASAPKIFAFPALKPAKPKTGTFDWLLRMCSILQLVFSGLGSFIVNLAFAANGTHLKTATRFTLQYSNSMTLGVMGG